MAEISPGKKLLLLAAEDRARAVLKPGDVLRVRRCGGVLSTFKMTGWDGHWITSATRDDIHASHIVKVNGQPVNFMEGP